MVSKKKALTAGVMAAALTASSVLPAAASAAGTRTKEEKFGDSTYAERFLSLYDDVITNGQENGYLSKTNTASGGFGVPYHAVETMIIEAPDYGHETTSEAMSYIV
ncbi:MAG: glycoside hydrolase family 48 protein, partial [Ruminococcus sp.]